MTRAIGIDIGTLLSRIGALPPATSASAKAARTDAGRDEGVLLAAPSVVARRPAGDAAEDDEIARGPLLAGERARRLSLLRPQATAMAAPRLLGRRYDSLDEQPWARALALSLGLTRGPSGDLRVTFVEPGEGERTPPAATVSGADAEGSEGSEEADEEDEEDAARLEDAEAAGEERDDEREELDEDVDEELDASAEDDQPLAVEDDPMTLSGSGDGSVDDQALEREELEAAAEESSEQDPRGPWPAPRLVGLLLRDLRRELERTIFDPLEQPAPEQLGAVVSVPAAHDAAQRRALVDACSLAGVRVRRLVHPTTAAALVYRARRLASVGELLEPELLTLVHVGHGNAEVAIVSVGPDGVDVMAVRGLADVGGLAFDERVVEWMSAAFLESSGVDADADPVVRQRMLDAASKAKVVLSELGEVELNLPYLSADESGPRHLRMTLTQTRFEKLIEDLVERLATATERALADARVDVDAVAKVLVFGGAGRVPLIQERLELMFKREPELELDQDDVVVEGAALLAEELAARKPTMIIDEVAAHPLVVDAGGAEPVTLIERGTRLPVEVTLPPNESRAWRLYQDDVLASGIPGRALASVRDRADGPPPRVQLALDNQVYLKPGRGADEDSLELRELAFLPEAERARLLERAGALELEHREGGVAKARAELLERWTARAEKLLAERPAGDPDDAAAKAAELVLAPLAEVVRDARACLLAGDPELLAPALEGFGLRLDELPGDIAESIRGEESGPARRIDKRVRWRRSAGHGAGAVELSTSERGEGDGPDVGEDPSRKQAAKRPPPRVA